MSYVIFMFVGFSVQLDFGHTNTWKWFYTKIFSQNSIHVKIDHFFTILIF